MRFKYIYKISTVIYTYIVIILSLSSNNNNVRLSQFEIYYVIAHSLTVYEYLRASDSREKCKTV